MIAVTAHPERGFSHSACIVHALCMHYGSLHCACTMGDALEAAKYKGSSIVHAIVHALWTHPNAHHPLGGWVCMGGRGRARTRGAVHHGRRRLAGGGGRTCKCPRIKNRRNYFDTWKSHFPTRRPPTGPGEISEAEWCSRHNHGNGKTEPVGWPASKGRKYSPGRWRFPLRCIQN